jgi:hypothetical protein
MNSALVLVLTCYGRVIGQDASEAPSSETAVTVLPTGAPFPETCLSADEVTQVASFKFKCTDMYPEYVRWTGCG